MAWTYLDIAFPSGKVYPEYIAAQEEFLMQTAKQKPAKLVKHPKHDVKWKSVNQKLTELYLEECHQTLRNKHLFGGSHLLDKLVARDKLNCLVMNLYPGNEGYSVTLRTRTGSDVETIRLPYEESELLHFLDNEELPPILVDLLERSQASIFYNGCVIVEVRDFRRSPNPATCECHHVLLKPTTQSVMCDSSILSSEGHQWSLEDRQAIEAALVLSTAEPLCLDPSVTVAVVANRLHNRKHHVTSLQLQRMVKRHSQVAINRKRKFEHCQAPPYLRIYDHLARRNKKWATQLPVNFKLRKQMVDTWKQKEVDLAVPSVIEVEKYAKVIERPKPSLETQLQES